MTVIELKEKLISQINSTNNEDLLEEISRIIDFELESGEFHEMSAGEIEAVEDGLRQLKNGQKFSHEEVKRQVDEWLKK